MYILSAANMDAVVAGIQDLISFRPLMSRKKKVTQSPSACMKKIKFSFLQRGEMALVLSMSRAKLVKDFDNFNDLLREITRLSKVLLKIMLLLYQSG